jgi:hypothetical protein
MNHYSGMEMAQQRQGAFEREAALRRRIRATKTGVPAWKTHLPRLLGFGRARGAGAEAPRPHPEWRLFRP